MSTQSIIQAVPALYYFLCFLTSRSLSEAILCKGSAEYKLTFKGEWTRTSHPQDFPSGAHFSSVVGCSHNSSYIMWKPGIQATPGVEQVAETGGTGVINREINQQISRKTALDKFQGLGINNDGTTTVNNIQVNSQYPLVSVISMIAPSPDWFVGVHDYSLCDETTGKWLDKRVRNLPLYDAGTDSGPRFSSRDQTTTPPESIFLINNTQPGSFQSNNPINRFGTFTFEKTSESNTQPELTNTNISSPSVPFTPSTQENIKPTSTKVTVTSPPVMLSPTVMSTSTEPSLSTAENGARSMVHFGNLMFSALTFSSLFIAYMM